MLKTLRHMSIARKLWLALVVAMVLALGNGLVALSRLDALNQATAEIQGNWFTALSHLADVRHSLTDERRSVNAHLLAPSEPEKAQHDESIRQLHQRIEESWGRYLPTLTGPEERQMADGFWKAFERYKLRQRPVLELSRQGLATDARALLLQEAEEDYVEAKGAIDRLMNFNRRGAEVTMRQAEALHREAELWISAGLGISLALLVGLAWALRRYLLGPIQSITGAMSQIAAGVLDTEVPYRLGSTRSAT